MQNTFLELIITKQIPENLGYDRFIKLVELGVITIIDKIVFLNNTL